MKRDTGAKGTLTVTPFAVTGVSVDAPATGFPRGMEYGPNCCRNCTPGLFGNAAANCASPSGVGVSVVPLEKGDEPMRIRCRFADPKNHSLSRRIGPPTVPPKRLSIYLGTSG